MRNFPVLTAFAALCFVLNGADCHADGGHVKLPRHVPVKAFADAARSDEISVFGASGGNDAVPTFVGKKGQPMTMDAEPRIAGFDHARLLTNVTKDQQKQIQALQNEMNSAISKINDDISSLQAKLIPPPPKPAVAEVNAEIDGLRTEIKAIRKSASEKLETILTDEQREQIRRMRAGEVVSP